jgi:hypothetical protein
MNDQAIEAAAKQAGGRWDGSRWVFEDADLHPFARALMAAERARLVAILRTKSAAAAGTDKRTAFLWAADALERA